MRKLYALSFLMLLFITQISANSAEQKSEKKTEANAEISSDWALYSKGLYHKSQGEYEKAIKYFSDAVKSDIESDRIYYQIAECYFYLRNYDASEKYCRMSIEKNKNNTSSYTLIYKIYFSLYDFEKAAAALKPLLDIDPKLVYVHYTLAMLYYKNLEDYDQALVYFTNILELSDTISVEDYYKENASFYIGRIYFARGQLDESIEYFKNVLDINPDNYVASYLLGYIYMNLYNTEEAGKYAGIYLTQFPENEVMNACIGMIYYFEEDPRAARYLAKSFNANAFFGQLSKCLYSELKNNNDEAEQELHRIISKDPQQILPHIALAKINLKKDKRQAALSEYFTAGTLLYKNKAYDLAIKYLTKALSINDKIPETYYYLGKAYEETGHTSLAIVYLKKSEEISPDPEIEIYIGYLFSLKSDWSESSKYLDMAIARDPDNPSSYFFKGIIFSKRMDYPKAEENLRKAVKLKENSDVYFFYLATVLEKQKKYNETIEYLKKAVELNPQNDMVCNYLGYLYADLNINLDESLTLIQKALAISPSNGAYFDSLGWAYYRRGDYNLALKSLLQAEKLLDKEKNPDAVVFEHIGDTYKMTGDKQKALEYWNKSLKLKEDSSVKNKILNYN